MMKEEIDVAAPATTLTRTDDNNVDNNDNTNHQKLPQWLQDFPYHTCVASNEPTPLELVRERLPRALMSTDASVQSSFDDNKLPVLVHNILQGPNKIQDKNSSLSLREIQVQIMLRLELYCTAGETFLKLHTAFVKTSISRHLATLVDKPERRRYRHLLKQTKSMSPAQILVDQIKELLSRAIFQLDANTPFVSYCRDCLPQHLFPSIPVLLQDILDGFEIRNPWEELEKTDDQAISELYLSPVKKQPSKKRRSFVSSLDQEEDDKALQETDHDAKRCENQHLLASTTSSTTAAHAPKNNQGCDTIHSLVRQPSLATNFTTTVRKRNSLVKDGGKPRLLASHFNAKLSNVSTLFRQVQMTSAVPKQPVSLKQQSKQNPLQAEPKGLLHRNNSNGHNNSNKPNTAVSTTKRKLLTTLHHAEPKETKRSKTENASKPILREPVGIAHEDGIKAGYACSPCPAAVKNKSRGLLGTTDEEEESQRRVVYETPLKLKRQPRRSSHPLTPLGGISNCIVQETPTKNVVNAKSNTSTSPFWDRAKLLAEASQVLRRNQRKEDTFW